MHRLLEKGVLPYSGGWLDQPNCYADAMSLITGLEEDDRPTMNVKVNKLNIQPGASDG